MPQNKLTHLQDLLNQVAGRIDPPSTFVFKSMFGGMCAYYGENVFASLSDVGLALKLAPSDQEEILAIPGAQRLRYDASSPPSKQYIVVPPSLHQDLETLTHWVGRSLEHVRHIPRSRSKKKKEQETQDKVG